jgi:hypothetical protein
VTSSADDLELMTRIAHLLATGLPADGGRMLENLRTVESSSNPYVPARLVHEIATSTSGEQVHSIDHVLGRGVLVTTSERLVWTDGDDVRQVRLADLKRLQALKSADRGVYGVRLVAGSARHDLDLASPEDLLARLARQRGRSPRRYVRNLQQLSASPVWGDIPLEARAWLRFALASGPDEEFLHVARCRYISSSWLGHDLSRTTAVVLTTKRLLWARVGAFAGLSHAAVALADLERVRVAPEGWIFVVHGGREHGFADPSDRAILRAIPQLAG